MLTIYYCHDNINICPIFPCTYLNRAGKKKQKRAEKSLLSTLLSRPMSVEAQGCKGVNSCELPCDVAPCILNSHITSNVNAYDAVKEEYK